MIKRIKYVVFSVILLLVMSNINAYTKEDIINLASSIKTCTNETSSLVEGLKVTYTRMLNERDISDSDLTKIYNNINSVKEILIKNNVCSKETLSNLKESVKEELYSLYKNTNKVITKSPKYVEINDTKTTSSDDVKIVIDSSSNQIKIYEGGTLINVVGDTPKLNYVGLNKGIIGFILILLSILIFMTALRLKGKKSIFITSFIYASILLLFITVVFRDNISSFLDKLNNMSVVINNKEKDVAVKDNKIISYPSYNNKYAKIYIKNEEDSIYFGDSSEILSKGIGQTTTSSLPGEGKTTILSGHNTGLFKNLFDLYEKEKIVIETIYGKFTYEVIDSKIVKDIDIDAIEEDYDLILYTCYPNTNIYGNKRLIIYLDLVKSEWLGESDEK